MKFAITADASATLPPTYSNSSAGNSSANNAAIYAPIAAVGGRGGLPAQQVYFSVEVKLLSDDQPALVIDVNVS